MSSFLSFAELCQRVEGVSGSLEKVDLVAAFLKNLDDDELAVASGFIMGDLFSPSMDLVMGVGPSILYEAMARACGCSTERISDMLRATGDPGLVASAAVDKKKPIGFAAFIKDEPLSIKEVYQRLVAVARASGKGSQDAKVKNLQYLFSQATPLEAQYIARLAIEDMRIGIGEGGVRDAIAQAFSQDASKVERAYNLTNDIGLVAVNARKGTLADLSVLINHPIKMMLAQVGEGISASMQELGSAAIEWKYDGARVQIHKDGKRVRIFSRRLEDVTRSLPEIVRLAQEVRADKAILDGEVVAIGKDSRPLAFQEILKRFRRKYNVEKQAKETPLHLFLFDLIYLDGQSTVDLPLTRRRELLEGIADPSILADQVISDSVQRAEEIYHQALEKGHEGLILKNSMSVYAPGKRGKNWLKIKPVMETLDLAVIGAKWGEGRRASFLGSYRLACLDEATSKLQDIGWVATGLTDEALAELTELFRELILVQNGMEVELKPAVIFEVAYEEIQKSQSYSSGYALRFPRLVRVRDDKSLEEADSLERVESLYRVQRGRNNSR
ncbi:MULTISPECIES: ATP-dependent DNA ligase [Methanothrix]|jgi:DNA ligase-1|uniref:DNA ligase n=1 Tax=Methanothrix soehngenii (strain ATCC 5969 / DSM 3671 / JCM 10134 / NBRC 103675 / OCM 69 / GP-6) TaxID=990316 RepID=F4BY86_METSG|nr:MULTISPECIES: ATP-dependent DNA ligase [Methanothrix]AEB67591.1 DNA ligase [Methanothrix soehngenii GP6]HPY92419.1 ATP-dependent DNA ligase [Methanothrix soehngenii]